MSWGEWLFFVFSVVFSGLAMIAFLHIYRKWNIRRGKSCDWCTHYYGRDADELCTVSQFADEPVPFIRTCFEFDRKSGKGSWE